MKAASSGPIAVPKLPPTWNTDCARPCRPPEASRATREDSGWNTEEPMPISAAASENHEVARGKRHDEQADQRGGHAEHQRIGRRVAVGVIADHRLQQRCRALEGEGDEADLAEIELEGGFQHRIDRHDQRLDHVVQHVADADRGEHRDDGAFGVPSRARLVAATAFLPRAAPYLCLDRHELSRR